jgi:hypothetical protein
MRSGCSDAGAAIMAGDFRLREGLFLMAGINYGELSAETFGVSVAIAFFDAI